MTGHLHSALRILGMLALCDLLCQCSVVDSMVNPPAVIYALAPQRDLPSPLSDTLETAGPAISFPPNKYLLNQRQRAALKVQAAKWQKDSSKLLVLGFARRGLPSGYARVLSQRRAESARKVLIEEGIDAARVHTAGYGHDQPALSTNDEIKLFILN